MIAAYGARTLASAKPYVPAAPDEHHVELIEMRRRKEAERKAAKEKSDALLAEQRRIARETILKGRKAARRFASGESHRASYDKIEKRICKALGFTSMEIRSDRRNREVVFARQAIVYWCCRLTSLSTPQIGRRMRRDYTTILHSRDAYPTKRAAMGRKLREVR